MPLKNTIAALTLCLCCLSAAPQGVQHDFGFARSQEVDVLEHGIRMELPWCGGMNSVRFSEIDLDLDGTDDLVAFEKHGDRLLTFIRDGQGFTYAPQYARLFPPLHDWAILKDFNGDGRPDIFTYGLAGIRVFQNISENYLELSLVENTLMAYYYNGYVNLYSSPDDYIVVDDVDGDGKTDILNFYVLGKHVHFLKNHAGDNAGFDLRLEDECWGKFSEAADNNAISLLTYCSEREGSPLRHTGSSLLLHDFDGNGLADILIGDVDSPHLTLLLNGGSPETAVMTSKDTLFPCNSPVNLFSMPAASFIKLPGHVSPSLVVSPSDPSLTKSKDLNSVWVYDYNTALGEYTLTQTDFLQGEMIDVGSGSCPVLFDYDNDGLADLFVGNFGSFDSVAFNNGFAEPHFSSSISHYKNTGTSYSPEFTLQTRDFGNLKRLGLKALHPTFGDFDGDGLTDMLCGCSNGTLILVPNATLTGNSTAVIHDYLGVDVGDFSTPQHFDLDNDGKKDLVIGNRRGTLSYFRNTGGSTPAFDKVSNNLGGVDVRDHEVSYFGYSVPWFYRSHDSETFLFCGSESGKVSLYKGIDGNIDGQFVLAVDNIAETVSGVAEALNEGIRTGVAVAPLNGDSFPEIIVGNYAGGLSYFRGVTPPDHLSAGNNKKNDIIIAPNPNNGTFTIKGDAPLKRIEITDLSGRTLLVKDNIADNEFTVRLGNAANGMYFVKIEGKPIIKAVLGGQ